VRTILPDTPTNAPLKTWIHEAQDEAKWNALISEWWKSLPDEEDDEKEINRLNHKQKNPPHRQDVTSH
jgi:hypothetical protein